MKIALADDSVFVNWRRISIIGEGAVLKEAQAVLTQAGIPHIRGSHHPCKSTVAKKRSAEVSEIWLLVPMGRYSDACSILFTLPEVRHLRDLAGCDQQCNATGLSDSSIKIPVTARPNRVAQPFGVTTRAGLQKI